MRQQTYRVLVIVVTNVEAHGKEMFHLFRFLGKYYIVACRN